MVWTIFKNLESEGAKTSLKLFLAMHITSFYIFTVQNIFMEHDLNI